MLKDAQFVVGIDLGTTHTVVASSPFASHGEPQVLPIPQLVSASERASEPLLPSLLYAPLAAEHVVDLWDASASAGSPTWVVGELARRRGVEAPGRLVASAKSWLTHAGVDRTSAILPWGAGPEPSDTDAGPKISPRDASAAILKHVRHAWDQAHPGAPLASQDVVLTVPASFDEVARELTLSAAVAAGLEVKLLEEPLAAFYDYRRREGDAALREVVVSSGGAALVLVCDVGGGTTDLSLVRVSAQRAGDALDVTRVAVGRHLLLGGDNMDLALAYACESRLAQEALDPARFQQLVLVCRAAKELLLKENAPTDVGVSVTMPGSKLVGNTRSTRLTRDETLKLVLDGFFPVMTRGAGASPSRAGLMGFGLPYERDVAITRHVASFFERHAAPALAPSALLLNGGVFHARPIVERLAGAIEAWGAGPVRVLPHADPDLAVARGAVAYGLARRGSGPVIRSGSARGYYVEVAPDEKHGRAVVCVVPRGTEEGVPQAADSTPLALVVGRPARFELFSSDNARDHVAGEVVRWGDVELEPLPPVFTAVGDPSLHEESVRVTLQGELTPAGRLDLALLELEAPATRSPRRFRLAFELRGKRGASVAPPPVGRAAASRQDELAAKAISRVFGKGTNASAREVKDLVRDLERLLGERSKWDVPTARGLFDALVGGGGAKSRRLSPEHERVFWQLAGFCLRPGVGDAGDPARVDALFRLLPDKLAFADQARGWQQFWFAWRRVAMGLSAREQLTLRDLVDPFVAPKEARRKLPKWKPDALDALIEMASALERVPATRRAELGTWLEERTWGDHDARLWAAIGRLGARKPAYAGADHIVEASVAAGWVTHLLRESWADVPTAVDAALRMARVTGDRARDLPERLRTEVAKRLVASSVATERVRTVEALVEDGRDGGGRGVHDEHDQAAFFGEGMPIGLQLVRA